MKRYTRTILRGAQHQARRRALQFALFAQNEDRTQTVAPPPPVQDTVGPSTGVETESAGASGEEKQVNRT